MGLSPWQTSWDDVQSDDEEGKVEQLQIESATDMHMHPMETTKGWWYGVIKVPTDKRAKKLSDVLLPYENEHAMDRHV